MRLSIPAFVLAAFVALSLAMLAIGGALARKQVVERVERDRGAHEQLASEIGAELRRLESRYEAHLAALLTRAEVDTGASFVNACRNIKGVRHFTQLYRKPGGRDLQIEIRVAGMASVAAPVLSGSGPGVGKRELLAEQLFPGDGTVRTWLREPGRPALFVGQHDGTALILSIDEEEVRTSIDNWLRGWSQRPFAAVSANGGQDRIVGPAKVPVVQTKVPDSYPDWVLPIGSQFGTWRIESWDQRVVRHSWHASTLAGTIGGAMLTLMTGVWLALGVRRERKEAEQRVSFVNRVSHELRTPLTNMLLNLDIVMEEVECERSSGRLSLVREEARRLGRLIANVLSFSRREREHLDMTTTACSPAVVVDEVIEQFTPAFARRLITVERECDHSRKCLFHADALAQITANLLSNVEKYAPGGEVHISLIYDNDHLILTVADQGPGVPAHAAERIFRPFERLDTRLVEGVTGTGLGLAIARDLAHRMAGTLQMIPSSRGATFQFRAPAAPLPELHSSSAA